MTIGFHSGDDLLAGDIVKLEAIWTDDYWLVTVAGLLEDRRVLLDDSGETYVIEALMVRILDRPAVPWEPGMVLRARVGSDILDDLQLDTEVPDDLREPVLLVPGSRVNWWKTVPQEFPNDEYEFRLDDLIEYEVETYAGVVLRRLLRQGVQAAYERARDGRPSQQEVIDSIQLLMETTYRYS